MSLKSEKLQDRIRRRYKSAGLYGLLGSAKRLIFPQRGNCAKRLQGMLKNRRALEVGGPSAVFGSRGILPVYPSLSCVDNANFAATTVWQSEASSNKIYQPDSKGPRGSTYVCDAVDMAVIADASYDVVLSSHVLEHLANPVKALKEWSRVLNHQGLLVLLTPRKEATFDHRRPTTSLEHLLDDYQRDVTEHDLTHLDEILELHDLDRDVGVSSYDEFAKRSKDNARNRCLHHHVFDLDLLQSLLSHLGWEILELEICAPAHSIVVARKP